MGIWLALALWTSVSAQTSASVPRLEMKSGETAGICSAVVFEVDADQNAAALTAGHCVESEPTAHFDLTVNGRHGEVVMFNRLLDLAIIRFRAHKETAIAIAPDTPADGSDVMVIGYAFGVEHLVKQFGHVAQGYNRETKSIWIDAMTIFGDSGGAVVDDQGRLIAVTSKIYSGGLVGQSAHIAAAVPVEAIHDFIDAYRRKVKDDAKRK